MLSGSANAVLHGKISGSKLTIAITPALQQPVPNVYSALNDLLDVAVEEEGLRSLISSVGCKSKEHKISVTVGYVAEPDRAGEAVRVQHGRREVLVVPTRTI